MAPAAPITRVLWLTGLSGAGKSTIAEQVAARLRAQGQPVAVLDGDDLRNGLNSDLKFSAADRAENVRRVAEVARLMVQAGLTVVVALISPFHAGRAAARARFAAGQFVEVYVNTPLAVAEARDPKGLYRRARQGLLAGFTGIDSPYEPPLQADVCIDTSLLTLDEAVALVLAASAKPAG